MDAMTIRRNAIPLFGSSLQSSLRDAIIGNKVSDIYLALDTDALRKALDIADYFVRQDKKVYIVELEGKDPNEVGFEGMMEKIRNSNRPLTLMDIVKAKKPLLEGTWQRSTLRR